MGRLRMLDLFCGSGGASMGYYNAGFEVVGVDSMPQRRYPFEFHQADALTYDLQGFDFIHASPPCQKFTALRHMPTAKEHPDLIPQTRALLVRSGIPYCIENVEGAPLGESGYLIMLCGTMFGLQTADGRAELRRHRLFETSFSIPLRPACQHNFTPLGVYGGHVRDRCRNVRRVGSLSVCGDYAEVNANRKASRNVLTVTGHTTVDNRRHAICVAGTGLPLSGKMPRRAITVTGSTPQTNLDRNRTRETFTVEQAREAMGISWMTMAGLSQAIPPAYSFFIGKEALAHIQKERAA